MSETDRKGDEPSNNATTGTVLPPPGTSEELYFSQLLAANGSYCNCLEYQSWPGMMPGTGYNSNGYVTGILNATGGTASVVLSGYIGAKTPVPASAFFGGQ